MAEALPVGNLCLSACLTVRPVGGKAGRIDAKSGIQAETRVGSTMSEEHAGQEASPWIDKFLPPATGCAGQRALDVACGSGRHLQLARQRGYRVTGIDRDTGRARGRGFDADTGIELIEADLEDGRPFPAEAGTYAAVIVANYLWRPILPDIIGCVARDGVLLYETFGIGNERFGKPSNPDFLLRPGELIEATAGRLVPIAYRHVRLSGPDRIVQRLCAVGADHEWLRSPPPL